MKLVVEIAQGMEGKKYRRAIRISDSLAVLDIFISVEKTPTSSGGEKSQISISGRWVFD